MNLSLSQLVCIALVKLKVSFSCISVVYLETVVAPHILCDVQKKGTVVLMVSSDSIMAPTMKVAEWRFAWAVYGVQCVMMAGTGMMPPQCADNWDTMTVSKICIQYDNHNHAQ